MGRGQKFDVMIAIQRQILRESLVFLSFHEFYIHSSNQPIPQVGTSHGITCPRVEHQRKITDTANLKCQFSKMSFVHSLFYSCNQELNQKKMIGGKKITLSILFIL